MNKSSITMTYECSTVFLSDLLTTCVVLKNTEQAVMLVSLMLVR